ncbi:MAG: CAP domain-containing protein [Paracoccus sp. (in: a-proteobacteria)]
MSQPYAYIAFASVTSALVVLSGCDVAVNDQPPTPAAIRDSALSDPAVEYATPLCTTANPLLVEQIQTQLNEARDLAGKEPLTFRGDLDFAAQAQACDMATMGRLNVAGSNGSSVVERVRAVEYRACASAQLVGNSPDAYSQLAYWLERAPDREVIVHNKFDDAGIGVVQSGGKMWWSLVMTDNCQDD